MRGDPNCGLKFEHPALIATAQMNKGSFAELLERRLKRIE
jgi:hypothetical protein